MGTKKKAEHIHRDLSLIEIDQLGDNQRIDAPRERRLKRTLGKSRADPAVDPYLEFPSGFVSRDEQLK